MIELPTACSWPGGECDLCTTAMVREPEKPLRLVADLPH